MTAARVNDLTGAIRHLGSDAAMQRDAQLLAARRLFAVVRTTAAHGSIPSTANVLGWMTAAVGIVASTVLEAGPSQPAHVGGRVRHGFTIVDRSLTRC